jgi:putative hemin transport protein
MKVKIRSEATELRRLWAMLRAAEPRLRAYDAAARLGVTEAELTASLVGDTVTRLQTDLHELLAAMGELGTVMGLTRNPHAVIEKHGRYRDVDLGRHAGTVLDPGLDLRIFPQHWVHAYAVCEGPRRSLQFFDRYGVAVHKTFLLEESNVAAYDSLVHGLASPDQTPGVRVELIPPASETNPPDAAATAELRRRWSELRDTHDFFHLLRELKVERTEALRAAGPEWARPVDRLAARTVLEWAAASGTPIMVFVGNRGNIEIHTGPVHNVKQVGDWYNVLDADFNLHLHEPGIDAAWVVRKPTVDGIVTSLELYAADGSQIVSFFGKRKPGTPELEQWRAAAAAL